jgi:uncharacterized protein YndB with AHSA1/START domain
MATTTETAIERELEIAASPETVWELLVDQEKSRRWMGGEATLDARPGGEYRIDVISGNVARGEFLEVERPRRLVWTFGWEPREGVENPIPPGSSRVEVELEATEAGTRLRFRHSGLETAEAVRMHGIGWDHYLARLAIAAAGGDPGPDFVPDM